MALRPKISRIIAHRISLASAALPIVVRTHDHNLALEDRIAAFDKAQDIARGEHLPGNDGMTRVKPEFLKIAAAHAVAGWLQSELFEFLGDELGGLPLARIPRAPPFKVIARQGDDERAHDIWRN